MIERNKLFHFDFRSLFLRRMLRTVLFVAIILFLINMLTIYGWCDDKRAWMLFDEAAQFIKLGNVKEELSYRDAYECYESALSRLDMIVTVFPSSNLASGLLDGSIRIENHTVAEFRESFIPQAKKRADAEINSFSCALYLADNMIQKTFDEIHAVDSLCMMAFTYLRLGQNDEALKIADKIVHLDFHKSRILIGVMSNYLSSNNPEKAIAVAQSLDSPFAISNIPLTEEIKRSLHNIIMDTEI